MHDFHVHIQRAFHSFWVRWERLESTEKPQLGGNRGAAQFSETRANWKVPREDLNKFFGRDLEGKSLAIAEFKYLWKELRATIPEQRLKGRKVEPECLVCCSGSSSFSLLEGSWRWVRVARSLYNDPKVPQLPTPHPLPPHLHSYVSEEYSTVAQPNKSRQSFICSAHFISGFRFSGWSPRRSRMTITETQKNLRIKIFQFVHDPSSRTSPSFNSPFCAILCNEAT